MLVCVCECVHKCVCVFDLMLKRVPLKSRLDIDINGRVMILSMTFTRECLNTKHFKIGTISVSFGYSQTPPCCRREYEDASPEHNLIRI